jgi:Protein of unknown function (DUF3592)
MLIAFGLMFACLGIYVLLFWHRQLQKEKQALNWPVVNGTVIESHVIAGDSNSADVLKFIYSYEFTGNKYTSSTIDFFESPSRLTNSELNDFSQKYPVNSMVKVYCNPLNGTGVLLPNSPENANRTRNLGIFLLIIGVTVLIIAFKQS